MALVAKPMFLGMENHLRLLSKESERPEGQKQGGRPEEALFRVYNVDKIN